jgi:hypothetical protein
MLEQRPYTLVGCQNTDKATDAPTLRRPRCTGEQAGHEQLEDAYFPMTWTEPREPNGRYPNASDSADVKSGGVSEGASVEQGFKRRFQQNAARGLFAVLVLAVLPALSVTRSGP